MQYGRFATISNGSQMSIILSVGHNLAKIIESINDHMKHNILFSTSFTE